MNKQQAARLSICREAFERLKEGKGQVKYVEKMDISCSTVSVEAGFDKGYLKQSRLWQASLVEDINDYKKGHESKSTSAATELERTRKKVKKATDAKVQAESLLYTLMQDNLKLVSRVAELEKLIGKYESGKVVNMKDLPL
jgi:hypothetical protein